MAMDLAVVRQAFAQAVPLVGTMNLEFEELEYDRAVMKLPDDGRFHNHVGGPHAGAMFTLAESASGALVLANFGDRLDAVTPLAVEATIRYLKLAMGAVTATAVLDRSIDDIMAELAAGQRPEFSITVVISNGEGVATGEMVIRWTLKPNRPAAASAE